ncbi:MAG TPA: hypothetical protein VK829_11410 [Terriglobales bacterium]|jgi:hypothetical protein|nr:hypothetical protein [Terriglobales bacterium]
MKLQETRKHQLLSLFIALVFALTMDPSKAQAQVVGKLEADIPFQFYAGNTALPPGRYIVHVLDNTDLTIMEISSADGKMSALFDVRDAEANSAPAKDELIFNKYGNRYFLEKVFNESDPNGTAVIESRYEKRIDKTTAEAQEHVPARHQGS